MFSLNVPLPPAVDRLADDLHPRLVAFDRIRERRTLLCKRISVDDVRVGGSRTGGAGGRSSQRTAASRDRAIAELRERIRPVLAGIGPIDLRITGIDYFRYPTRGPGPVVYLRVESDGLHRVHRRLCSIFDPVAGMEGDEYIPHVTLARGGDVEAARRISAVDVDPIEWRTQSLEIYDPDFREPAATIEL
ncbi:2'-5' RNA ligase family protein [Halopenitus sp. H-Gu1]|uniref:2'-5' RNA ligase family protein n=1 Tax=Halopenitus sp. H-Gu1 TaxID=3242697 RepID=UPI00359D6849